MTAPAGPGGVAIQGIVLVAENFAEQVAFFRDQIGLHLASDWGDAVRFVGSNGVELTIFATSHDQASLDRLAPARHGLSHLEFGVGAAERAHLEEELRRTGRATGRSDFLDTDGQLFHFVTKGA